MNQMRGLEQRPRASERAHAHLATGQAQAVPIYRPVTQVGL